MRNPVFAYEGPDSPSIPIGIILFDSSRHSTRGTFVRTPVTSGNASDGNALVGITAWADLPHDFDEKQVQYCVPDVNGAGLATSQQYRVVKAQRHHGTSYWTTTQLILVDEPEDVARGPDFSPLDFSSSDFLTRRIG